PAFSSLIFILMISFFALVAGYTVMTREIEVSRVSAEFHELLISTVRGMKDIENEGVRQDLAEKMRLISENIEGLSLPTTVEDKYGGIPVVLPTSNPVKTYTSEKVDEILDDVGDDSLTGYVMFNDNDVFLLRNGNIVIYYVNGEYDDDTDHIPEIGTTVYDEFKEVEPEPEEEEERKIEEISSGEGDAVIDVGGNEVDIEEMFQKADEIMDELSE
ncbi:MAG: hypothetical protein SV760_05645, partial [Halobacteria archaeon]|nr:hypothetical protein [Halobacteria archaeon]